MKEILVTRTIKIKESQLQELKKIGEILKVQTQKNITISSLIRSSISLFLKEYKFKMEE